MIIVPAIAHEATVVCVAGPGENKSITMGTDNTNTNPQDNLDNHSEVRRSDCSSGLLGLGLVASMGLSVLAILLASIALLCWSANNLFIAVISGPSFEAARTRPLIATITPAIAVITVAISFMI